MAVGLTIIKRFTYRGAPEEWSNHYHLTGDDPASPGDWRDLFDAMCDLEKALFDENTQIVAGYGYDNDAPSSHNVWSVDLTIAPNTPVDGIFSLASGSEPGAGDSAAWVRWGLDRLNSDGKRVYLRKYFHPAYTYPDPDTISAPWITQAAAFGGYLQDDIGIDGRTIRDVGGADVIGHAVSSYSTTRTLKRRGKRPT